VNYYVDVDDTLVRSVGAKAIPIPATIIWVKSIDLSANNIYLWSRGGAEYAKSVAQSLGIDHLISAFLPKPDVLIDDQHLSEWGHLREYHPNQLGSVGSV